MTREEAIEEITRKLIEFYQPIRIYLFGSVARGDFDGDSDLDFLVVVPDDIDEEKLRPGADVEAIPQLDSPRTSFPGAGPISKRAPNGSKPPCPRRWFAKGGCSMTPLEAKAQEVREWLGRTTIWVRC